jgi:hypothetical protein
VYLGELCNVGINWVALLIGIAFVRGACRCIQNDLGA